MVVDSDALVSSPRLPSSAAFSESRGAHPRKQLLFILYHVVSFLSREKKQLNPSRNSIFLWGSENSIPVFVSCC